MPEPDEVVLHEGRAWLLATLGICVLFIAASAALAVIETSSGAAIASEWFGLRPLLVLGATGAASFLAFATAIVARLARTGEPWVQASARGLYTRDTGWIDWAEVVEVRVDGQFLAIDVRNWPEWSARQSFIVRAFDRLDDLRRGGDERATGTLSVSLVAVVPPPLRLAARLRVLAPPGVSVVHAIRR